MFLVSPSWLLKLRGGELHIEIQFVGKSSVSQFTSWGRAPYRNSIRGGELGAPYRNSIRGGELRIAIQFVGPKKVGLRPPLPRPSENTISSKNIAPAVAGATFAKLAR